MGKLSALNDRIVVEPELIEEKTKSGIYIPDTSKSKEQEAVRKGKVISVGPGMTIASGEVIKPKIEVGAIILYQPYAKTELEVDGKTLHVIRWEDVDCRWDDDNKAQS